MVIQLSIALVAIMTVMKDQVEHLNKIGAAATTIGIDEEAAKNRNFSVFGISIFLFAEFDTSAI